MLFLIFALLFPAKTTSYLCLLDCTSNCCDAVSVCNLDDQTCANDCNGGCIDFETTTWLETIFEPYYKTITSTVQTYTTAETTWEYDTVWSTELDTSTYYSTEYDTVTVTANVPTVTQPVIVTAKDYARLYGALLLAPRGLICTDNCYYSTKIVEITKISTSYTGTITTYQTSYDYYTPTFSSTSTIKATFTTYNGVTVWDTSTYTTTVDADAVTVYVTTTKQPPPPSSTPDQPSNLPSGSQLPASQSGDAQPPVSGPHPTVSAAGANSKSIAMSIDTSAALVELQSAVPMTAQTNPSAACFLQTSYKRCYATPTWWTSLPSNAKSYFATINAANTAACTSCANSTSSGSALSPGAKAGIGIGTVAGVAALGGLIALLLFKFGFIGGSSAAGTAAGGSQMAHAGGSSAAPTGYVGSSAANPGWSGVVGDPSGGGWSGVVGSGTGAAPPPPPPHHPIVPIPIIAGMRTRTESGGAQSPRDSSYAASQSQRIVPRRPVPESGAQSPVSLRSGVANPFESQAVYSGTLVGGRAAGELSGGERAARELPGTERSARELSGAERQVSELSEFSEERQTRTGSPSEFASRWS